MNRGKPTVFVRCLSRPSRGWLDDIRHAVATEVVVNGTHVERMREAMNLGPHTLARFVSGYPATSTTLARICHHLGLTVRISK